MGCQYDSVTDYDYNNGCNHAEVEATFVPVLDVEVLDRGCGGWPETPQPET